VHAQLQRQFSNDVVSGRIAQSLSRLSVAVIEVGMSSLFRAGLSAVFVVSTNKFSSMEAFAPVMFSHRLKYV